MEENNYYSYTTVRELVAWNKRIVCSPFETLNIELENKGRGFAHAKAQGSVDTLKVVVGTPDIPAGSVITLRGDAKGAHWAKEIWDWNGTKIIIVPEDAILWVERNAPLTNLGWTLNTTPMYDYGKAP